MPSLLDLQSISISDTVDYEVALVNRVVDSALQQLERRASQLALECREAESGLIASGLIQKIAHLVSENMGGPVEDAEEMLRRWTVRSHEVRTSLNTIVLPLGLLGVGLSRHRALLFKVLADRVDLPCKLVKGSYYTGTDDGAINLIKVDYGSEYIVDLMGAPGTLIPAEVPSSHLENSGAILHSSDTIEQSVKDLCLALDKVSFQLEDKIEGSAVSSSDNKLVSRTVHLPMQEKSHQLCKVDYLRVDGNFPADGVEKEVEMLGQTSGGIQRETLGFIGDISPAEQMKVNNVSKYVVTAAKIPEFAQKLHAVLLESGASPPLDLFSSLNIMHEAVDQKISMDNMNVGRKNGGPSGSSSISTMETGLSNSRYNEDVLRKDVEEITAKQEQDSSLVANPAVSGNPSILRTNQGINLDTTESVGYPATEAVQQFDSKGTNNFGRHTSSGSLNESFNSLVVSVAEWEIPWEDLQIGERIGLGSYGEVYRADWNGTDVAVKKFLDQGLSGDALDLFRSEVKIMLRLRHPNVVLFLGAVTRPPNLSILTEFLPRGSLYRLLHRPNVKLDERRRLKMALDVAKGMNYLHASHPTIVHRDLKSPNLLVDRNWVVKVCDFGLSRLKHHTFLSSKSTAGTPEWMAPEVLRNEPSNEKCDIYSFGVILWELATLRMPWSGMNPMQVVGAVGYQNKRLEIPQEIDPMVANIINNCWESDPSQRPSFAQLLPPLKQLQSKLYFDVSPSKVPLIYSPSYDIEFLGIEKLEDPVVVPPPIVSTIQTHSYKEIVIFSA
ncbi:hypothetical protein HPP92_026785, partial [Vanilla planifolia]